MAGIDGPKGRVALLVGELDTAHEDLAGGAVRGLVGVEAARVAVPDVDRGAVDRLAPPYVDHPDLEL
jgi:hypothetical protein